MADFFDNLDRINAAAERMPGFVWRLKDDSGNATNIPWVGDPTMAVESQRVGKRRGAGEIRLADRPHQDLCPQGRILRKARQRRIS